MIRLSWFDDSWCPKELSLTVVVWIISLALTHRGDRLILTVVWYGMMAGVMIVIFAIFGSNLIKK